jgi:hypothetical protein
MLNFTSGRDGYQRESPPRMRMGNFTSGRDGYDITQGVQQVSIAHQTLMANRTSGRVGHSLISPYPPTEAEHRHNGVTCDGCSAGVTGIRYKCLSCPNFDLCARCMDTHETSQMLPLEANDSFAQRHPRDHYFVRIARDVGRNPPAQLVNRSNWIHHGISCAECNTANIAGYRYFCPMCATSYCEACEQKGLPQALATSAHQLHHNLLKMVPPPVSSASMSGGHK